MSAAYKCDRCSAYTDGEVVARRLHAFADLRPEDVQAADYVLDLCAACAADFTRWMGATQLKSAVSNGPIGNRIDWSEQAKRLLNPEETQR